MTQIQFLPLFGVWWKGDSIESAQFCETYKQPDGSTVCYEAHRTLEDAEMSARIACGEGCAYEARAIPPGFTCYLRQNETPFISSDHVGA